MILALMKEKNVSAFQLTKEIGLTNGLISQWKSKKQKPSVANLQKIGDYFGVSVDYLLGKTDPTTPRSSPVRSIIPVIGTVRAGEPIFAEENIIGYEFSDVANPEEYFFLSVTGDSMINAGIKDGSKVLVHKQDCAEDGQIVVCLVDGDEATLKRFRRSGDTVMLIPENPAYTPILLSCADFDNNYAKIIGVAKKVLSDL
jgi:repressor LexA